MNISTRRNSNPEPLDSVACAQPQFYNHFLDFLLEELHYIKLSCDSFFVREKIFRNCKFDPFEETRDVASALIPNSSYCQVLVKTVLEVEKRLYGHRTFQLTTTITRKKFVLGQELTN